MFCPFKYKLFLAIFKADRTTEVDLAGSLTPNLILEVRISSKQPALNAL